MTVLKSEVIALRSETDMVPTRQTVRAWAMELKFSLVDQTKVVTAASELARNTLIYGGGGILRLEVIHNGLRQGLRMTFEDKGPGIPDIQAALRDGFTSGSGLGLGLGGSKRLMNEFEIESKVGEGTRITVIKWK